VIKEFSAIALLLLSGCAASAPDAETVSRSSVSFVEPEFTDAGRAEFAPTSAGVLRELQKFLVESVAHYLPEPKKRFTDVDLAGDFELFRGRKRPNTHHQRSLPGGHHALIRDHRWRCGGGQIGQTRLDRYQLPNSQRLPERGLPAV
jgi:hypothetical protein